MNKLTGLYVQILQSLDCRVEEDGKVYIRPSRDSDYVPAKINVDGQEKFLVVPFKHVQRSPNWDELVAFHPACEVAFNGQSEVLNWIVSMMNLKLYRSVQVAVINLLTLASDKAKHDKLRVTIRKLLSQLPEVTPTTIKYLAAVIKKSTGTVGERPLLSLKLYRGRSIEGVKYNKTCRLLTPIMEEGPHIYGVKASGKSTEAILAAYNIVFPDVREVGTNSNEAGYLEALVCMYKLAAGHINELRETLGKHAGEMEIIDLSWLDEFAHLQKYRKLYLNQSYPGNTGYPLQDERKEVKPITVPEVRVPRAVAPQAARPATPSIPTVTAPVPQAAPVNRGQIAATQQQFYQQPAAPVDPNRPLSLTDRMKMQRGIVPPVQQAPTMVYQQPVGMQPMVPMGYAPGMVPMTIPMPMNPYMTQPVQQMQPRVVNRGDIASGNQYLGPMGR
jgi:hypothetical protein